MSAVTVAQLSAFNTSAHVSFNKGLGAQNQDWTFLAKEIPSSSKSNTYGWMSNFPGFREWVGSRQHKLIVERGFKVENRKFETTVDIPVDDFEDDVLGQYSAVFESHGEAIGDLKNEMVFGGIKACLTAICYDGQYFFDTDHPVYANADGTGALTPVSNYVTGAGELWVLLCTKRAPKPFYLQNRTGAPSLVSKTRLDSENVFENDVYTWGSKWRGEFVPGFWQLAYGSKAALTDASFDAGVNAQMLFKQDGNKQLNIVADTIVVGPANRVKARELFETATLPGGGANPLFGKVKVIVNPLMA